MALPRDPRPPRAGVSPPGDAPPRPGAARPPGLYAWGGRAACGTGRRPVEQIAYVGSDGHVHVAEADGSGARSLSESVAGLSGGPGWLFRWPTYSPDGRRLAFGGYRTEAGQML